MRSGLVMVLKIPRQPVSDIGIVVVDSLKALDPKRPIREASISLHKDAPLGRAIQRYGNIAAKPILSGLHHRYSVDARAAGRMVLVRAHAEPLTNRFERQQRRGRERAVHDVPDREA